jgi:hypothetical protein
MNPTPLYNNDNKRDETAPALSCENRELCFEFAARLGWPGVSCSKCERGNCQGAALPDILGLCKKWAANSGRWPQMSRAVKSALVWLFIKAPTAHPVSLIGARNVDCEHYNLCLLAASALDWPCFTCDDCGHYEPARRSETDIMADDESCMLLWAEVFDGENTDHETGDGGEKAQCVLINHTNDDTGWQAESREGERLCVPGDPGERQIILEYSDNGGGRLDIEHESVERTLHDQGRQAEKDRAAPQNIPGDKGIF